MKFKVVQEIEYEVNIDPKLYTDEFLDEYAEYFGITNMSKEELLANIAEYVAQQATEGDYSPEGIHKDGGIRIYDLLNTLKTERIE